MAVLECKFNVGDPVFPKHLVIDFACGYRKSLQDGEYIHTIKIQQGRVEITTNRSNTGVEDNFLRPDEVKPFAILHLSRRTLAMSIMDENFNIPNEGERNG